MYKKFMLIEIINRLGIINYTYHAKYNLTNLLFPSSMKLIQEFLKSFPLCSSSYIVYPRADQRKTKFTLLDNTT